MSGGEGGGGGGGAGTRVTNRLRNLALASVSCVPSWRLNYLHRRHLQPNEEFLSRANEEVDRICDFLKTRCFHDAVGSGVKVLKVVKGGSLGKGTSMKNGKMDLQLLSNIVNLYREQEKDRKEVTEAIAEWLKKWQKLRVSRTTKVLPLFHSISKLHGNKLKMYIEETAGRIKGWWKQPYLSDADLELLSKVFKSYTDEEKDWKVIDRIAEQFKKLPVEITDGILDLIKNYTDKEKDRKKIIKMTKRQVSSRQEKPYLSDADLVLFLNVFKSYTDQENSRKMIIEEIERRLKEWQQEAYLPEVDVELLLEFLKSYRDQKKDWKEITQKIETWVSECGKQLHLSEDERAFLNDLIKRKKEMDQMIIKEIARWRSEHQGEPYLSAADLGSLLDLIKRYRYHDKNQHLITEVISGCYSANQRLNQEDNRRVLLDLLKSYKKQEKDLKETTQEIEMWLHECKKKLYVSEAGLVPFRKLSERYLEEEKDQRMLTEEIARWRKAGQGERDLSDADLGLLLELTKRYTDKEEQQKRITEDIVRWFSECKDNMHLEIIFEKSKWPNPRVLQFKLRSKRSVDFIDFDVLPAYDALGQYDGSMPNPQIYVDLIRTGKSGEFSACFTELQRDFIKGRPTKLKSLIRLVKHWYNEVEKKSFPPKYALELLTVYAWEKGSGRKRFDLAKGFRTVLWLIEHYKEIRIYWTKYYDFDSEIIKQYLQEQLGKNRPVILDPADPTANFGEAKGWDQLAKAVKSYASMNCCRKRDGSLVEPWDVPPAKEVPWEEEGSYRTL